MPARNRAEKKPAIEAELRILYQGIGSLIEDPECNSSQSCKTMIRIVKGFADRHKIGLSSLGERISGRLPTCRRMLEAVDIISRVLEHHRTHKTVKPLDKAELKRLRDEILLYIQR